MMCKKTHTSLCNCRVEEWKELTACGGSRGETCKTREQSKKRKERAVCLGNTNSYRWAQPTTDRQPIGASSICVSPFALSCIYDRVRVYPWLITFFPSLPPSLITDCLCGMAFPSRQIPSRDQRLGEKNRVMLCCFFFDAISLVEGNRRGCPPCRAHFGMLIYSLHFCVVCIFL